MTTRTILRMGNPVLGRVARPVGPNDSAALAGLLADMVETMRSAGGVGLAAPQIGESLRVIIFEIPPARASGDVGDQPLPLQALINPEVEILDDAMVMDWEGCLSIPGLRGEVPRHARIRYRGLDAEGAPVDREASGFHARVIQHEIDHLDGVLYPERMTDMRRFGYAEEFQAQLDSPAAAPSGAQGDDDGRTRPG